MTTKTAEQKIAELEREMDKVYRECLKLHTEMMNEHNQRLKDLKYQEWSNKCEEHFILLTKRDKIKYPDLAPRIEAEVRKEVCDKIKKVAGKLTGASGDIDYGSLIEEIDKISKGEK